MQVQIKKGADMKNLLANLSIQMQGILLIIGGFILVINYFGFIKLLQPMLAIIGLGMILMGAAMADLYTKAYALIKKDNNQNQQPPQNL